MKTSYLFITGLIAVICSSCASIHPVTDNIIQQVGGSEQLTNFQYYISRDIVLTRVEHEKDGNVTAGEAKINETIKKDKVNIKKSTPGVVLNSWYYDNLKSHVLYVAFEDDDSQFLQFAHVKNANPNAYYSLMNSIHLQSQQRIMYGDTEYSYSFPENSSILKKVGIKKTKNPYGETPILLIKLKKSQKTITTKRTAKGRKIGQ
ncbi:MAG: hypothetical protein NC250_00025 [Alistipes senegalensis]|nr:hypothetical protein [Bacteroides cellulosilyticus]MCM1351111.1 hypothetical protein [Alistipes senegalensis]